MMVYENTEVKVCSLDGDIYYFDIVAGVLQGDTLAPYLFIIFFDYVLTTSIDLMIENGFKPANKRSKIYSIQSALLANSLIQSVSLLHSLDRVAGCIGLHVNADKTEYMCFN